MKKYRWNIKKFIKNLTTLLLALTMMTAIAAMFLYGIDKEVQYQELKYQSYQEEINNN